MQLGPRISLRVPSNWIARQSDDGRWWCGDAEGRATLFTEAEVAGLHESQPEPRTPTENAAPYVAAFERFLGEQGATEIATVRLPSGRVVRGVTEHESESERLRIVRWYVVRGFSDCVGILRLALGVRLPLRNEAVFRRLVEHFEAEAKTPAFRLETRPGEEAFQDFEVDGLFTFRIPADWYWLRMAEGPLKGMWRCVDPDGPARLLADYEVFEYTERGEAAERPLALARAMAEAWRQDWPDAHVQVADAPLGSLLSVVEDYDEPPEEGVADDAALRSFTWRYILGAGRRGLLVSVILTLPIERLNEPAVARLPAVIQREVRALRVGQR